MLIKKRPNWLSDRVWRRLMLQRDGQKYLRRQIVRFLKSPRLAVAYSAYRRAMRTADWPLVRERVKALTALAVQVKDRDTISDMVKALNRLGCYQESSRLCLAQLAQQSKNLPNEWRGEDLSGKTILVNFHHTRRQGLGVGYRRAQLLAKIIGLARRTMVIVEPRLVKTFRRSFPELEIFASPNELQDQKIDYIVLPPFLGAWFTLKEAVPDASFRALVPDWDKAADLRTAYLEAQKGGGKKLLIGIFWYSVHHGKDLPDLRHWRDFIMTTNAGFVSLQYGDVTQDVTALGRDRVIVDNSINQLSDMDDFAAQVAALDGVITIDSTLANVAGALDVPTVVLRDDWFRRNWPVFSDRVPWYPSVRVAGKNGRDWGPVFDEAWVKLRGLLAERPSAQRHAASAAAR